MISKNKIKYIHSLEQKKQRRAEGVFVAEGHKSVGDLLKVGLRAKIVICTEKWAKTNGIEYERDNFFFNKTEYCIVTPDELRKCSFLQHPQEVIAVFHLPEKSSLPEPEWVKDNLCLALDGVQDPGNMGTIIRIADWFGINTIICSNDTVDAYSPKTVQATMGSIARVRIIYGELEDFLTSLPDSIPVYGTLLDGNNIYEEKLSKGGIIIMGNEGNGISADIRKLVNHKLLIPSYPADSPTAESLNVAIATAITVAEFRRQM